MFTKFVIQRPVRDSGLCAWFEQILQDRNVIDTSDWTRFIAMALVLTWYVSQQCDQLAYCRLRNACIHLTRFFSISLGSRCSARTMSTVVRISFFGNQTTSNLRKSTLGLSGTGFSVRSRGLKSITMWNAHCYTLCLTSSVTVYVNYSRRTVPALHNPRR